ncbi:hypothetical protein BHM03_00008385 [Ensete ventricosum]|nr:hypothetical protein BHM03_00008385 [Ensete ventricosum]
MGKNGIGGTTVGAGQYYRRTELGNLGFGGTTIGLGGTTIDHGRYYNRKSWIRTKQCFPALWAVPSPVPGCTTA